MKPKIRNLIMSVVLLILILFFIYRVISYLHLPTESSVEEVEITYPDTTHQLDRDMLLPISDAKSITTDRDGTFYILGSNNLLIYSDTMQMRDEIPLSDSPQVVKYITDMGLIIAFEDSVNLLDKSGTFIERLWTMDRVSGITSLEAVDNYLFLLDVLNRRVIRLDLLSRDVKSFYRYDGKRFIIPSPYFEIVKSLGSTMWITDPGRHRVIQFDTDLNILSQFGEGSFTLEGFVGCCNPSNISLTKEGNIITAEKGEKRIKLYSYSGKYLGLIERLHSDEREITDLLIDRDDNIHILVGNYWRVYSEKDK